MTPAARVAAAAEILDDITAGQAAEQALTRWARGHRFAGSKDRAAIRDHVFDVMRCRRSCAARGGGESGRALMLGLLRGQGADPAAVFTGEGYAPAPLSAEEAAAGAAPEGLAALDCPEWLAPALRESLGAEFEPVMQALRERAEVFLRVNAARATGAEALAALADDGVEAEPGPLAPLCLKVTEGARRIRTGRAFSEGLVELQDAASQAICEAIPLPESGAVLDYCAGGGGKTLALAARAPDLAFTAHDGNPQRMADLPARASRAGVSVRLADAAALAERYALVVADVPCSGSGAWRRQPEAKWRLDRAGLEALVETQAAILDAAAARVAPGGRLAYVTCSLLDAENEAQAAAFTARAPGWEVVSRRRLTPLDGGDGFFLAVLGRPEAR